jgi:hypothetical protein
MGEPDWSAPRGAVWLFHGTDAHYAPSVFDTEVEAMRRIK